MVPSFIWTLKSAELTGSPKTSRSKMTGAFGCRGPLRIDKDKQGSDCTEDRFLPREK